MRIWIAVLLALSASVAGVSSAGAHALQPAYLDLQPFGEDAWRVFWRKPTVAGAPMAIGVSLPENCEPRTPPEPAFDGTAWSAQWIATCPGGLAGGEIAVPGLDRTQTDVLVRYQLADGSDGTHRLVPSDAAFQISEAPGVLAIFGSYFGLGVDHILAGIDHLLFVFALLLLIRDRWRLIGAVTAFTIAHSITLGAAVLGWIVVPIQPVEAVIALSIAFLASELLKASRGELRLSERYPWVVSFTFGLLHGFGFASALAEIGVPEGDVPLALVAFNLGVEAGQILFVAAVLAAFWLIQKAVGSAGRIDLDRHGVAARSLAYGIGGLAAFWFIERVAQF